jgi:hypothetical protein
LRNPEKFAVLFVFALAILAGLGFDRFRSKNLGRLASLGVGGALAIAALVCQMSPERAGRFAVRIVGSDPAWSGLASLALPGALAEAGILWMGTVLAIGLVRAGGAPRVVVGVLLITAAAVAVNGRIAQTYREDEVFAPTAFARTIRRLDPPVPIGRWASPCICPPPDIWNTIGGGEIVLNLRTPQLGRADAGTLEIKDSPQLRLRRGRSFQSGVVAPAVVRTEKLQNRLASSGLFP